jgi:hypothetical protein
LPRPRRSMLSVKPRNALPDTEHHADFRNFYRIGCFPFGFVLRIRTSELLSYPPRPGAIFFVIPRPLVHDVAGSHLAGTGVRGHDLQAVVKLLEVHRGVPHHLLVGTREIDGPSLFILGPLSFCWCPLLCKKLGKYRRVRANPSPH